MARHRIIECIGASDEDIAHMRLLLRSSRIHLSDLWSWGTEDKADVVIVDARSLIGDDACRKAQQRGITWARMIGAEEAAPEGRFLRRPFKRDDLVALLNGSGASSVAPLAILTRSDDFFDMDLGEQEIGDLDHPELLLDADVVERRSQDEVEHELFESMFRRDPLAEKPQFLMPDKFDDAAGVEFVKASTARSASRADVINPFSREELADETIDPSFRRDVEQRVDENATYPLLEYLDSGLLGGPARIVLPGAPALVLDPKEKVFHSQGKLPALEPYVRQPLRLGDWERLVSSELVALRLRVPARPYLRLVWMERFLNSDGYLSKHLDPAGTYRLKQWLELAQDYPRAFRVGANMISPLRLHEIARISEVGLAEVFDVVNAYEAIGYVEWAHRERVQRIDPA